MRENISITVPMEYNALKRASEMLYALGQDITHVEHEEEFGSERKPLEETPKPVVEGDPDVVAVATPSMAGFEAELREASEVFAAPAPTPEAASTPAPLPETGTAELDKNGLQWDARIHATTKTKLVTGEWKNKRGVDKELLASVEAELKGVMAIPTPEPVPAAPAPTPEAASAPTPTPAPTPAAPGSITTFPALMTAITSAGLEPAIVNGAVQAVGLQSLPLLATRTDLIPAVAERLGL